MILIFSDDSKLETKLSKITIIVSSCYQGDHCIQYIDIKIETDYEARVKYWGTNMK